MVPCHPPSVTLHRGFAALPALLLTLSLVACSHNPFAERGASFRGVDYRAIDLRVLDLSRRMTGDPEEFDRYYARSIVEGREIVRVVMVDRRRWGTYTRGTVAVLGARGAYVTTERDLPPARAGRGCSIVTMQIDPGSLELVPMDWFGDLALTQSCASDTPLVTPPEYGYGGPPEP